MPDAAILVPYVAACFLILLVPGPTVTVIIANSIRHGSRAGLLNVLGTQAALASMIAVLAFGLSAVLANMEGLFDVLRIIGAAYLIWLGIKLWRADGTLGTMETRSRPAGSFVLQGFIVLWSNPKALFFFGAFIPQFIDPTAGTARQICVFGAIFMVVAALSDGLYAVVAGNAGSWLSRRRVRLAERVSGTCLIGGGLWLALAKR